MKQKQRTFPLSLTPAEIGLGWLYLGAEFLLIPGIIYQLGASFGGFSDAAANFCYYLTNAVFCIAIFRRPLRRSLEQAGSHTRELLLCAGAAFLVYQVVLRLMTAVLLHLLPDFYNVNDAAVSAMVADRPLLMALGVIVLVPIAEESLFRGLIFIPLYRKNRVLGYLGSTLAFCAIHVVGYIGLYPPQTLLVCFLQYIPAGLVLGWACAGSGSLFAPMLVHSAINAVSFLTLR